MRLTGYIGRCGVKGCGHAARLEEYGRGDCPAHGRYRLEPLWGALVPEVKCGARCLNAVGPSCDCSCGGVNHGRGHAPPEQLDITGSSAAVREPEQRHEVVRLFEPAPAQIPGQLGF